LKTGKAFRLSARILNAVFKFSDNAEVCNSRTTGYTEVRVRGREPNFRIANHTLRIIEAAASMTAEFRLAACGRPQLRALSSLSAALF
jgi:hypothetical protein